MSLAAPVVMDSRRTTTSHRVPPHHLPAEESLLGAMLLSRDAIAATVGIVTAADFYKPAHGHIFDAISAVYGRGEAVDPVTVDAELRRDGLLDAVGGSAVLVSLQAATPATSTAARYAQIVREHADVRRLMAGAAEAIELGYESGGDSSSVLAKVASLVAEGVTRQASWVPEPIDWDALWNGDREAADWLVEPLIPTGRQVAIYAPAKEGKSLLALEAAAGLAAGRAVLAQPTGEPVTVLYLDFEQTEADLRERLEDMGYGPADLAQLVYLLLADLPPLDTAEGGTALLALVERHKPVLVVVDTVARAVEGEENSADTLRAFYRYTGRLLKAAGVAMVRLDHAGKDASKGQRGTSAKADDVDLVWSLSTDGRQVSLRRTHSRVPWVPETVRLERHDEPRLRHVVQQDSWPAGTAECAAELDRLDVPIDATVVTAMADLKRAGQGRRKMLVAAALRHRRERP